MRTEIWERVEKRRWFYLDFMHQGRLQLARVQIYFGYVDVSLDLSQMEPARAKHLRTQAVAVATIRVRKKRNAVKWARTTKRSEELSIS
jgi:hypothetical protein